MNSIKKRTKKFLKSSAKLFLEDGSWKEENLEELFKEILHDLPEGDIKQCLTEKHEKYKDIFIRFFPSKSPEEEIEKPEEQLEKPEASRKDHQLIGHQDGNTYNGCDGDEDMDNNKTDKPSGRKSGLDSNVSIEKESSSEKMMSQTQKKKLKKKTHLEKDDPTPSIPTLKTHNWKSFINSMMDFLTKMQSKASVLFKNGTAQSERTLKAAEELWDFVIVCHFHCQNLQSLSYVFPSYEDVTAALMSLYVDLITVWARYGEVRRKSIGKSVCMKVCYIVDKPKHLDIILTTEQMQSTDRKILLPFIRRCLTEAEPRSSHDIYLKYMLAVHKVCNTFGEKTADIYQTALTIPATKKFMAWLSDHSKKAVESMPTDTKFKRLQVTHFLLKEMTKELFEDLMDVLVGLSDPDRRPNGVKKTEDEVENNSESDDFRQKKKKKEKKNDNPSLVKKKETMGAISSNKNEDENIGKKVKKRKMVTPEENQVLKKKKTVKSLMNDEDGRVKKKNMKKKKNRKSKDYENGNSKDGEVMEKRIGKEDQDIFFIDKGNVSPSDSDVASVMLTQVRSASSEEMQEEDSCEVEMVEDSEEMEVTEANEHSDNDISIVEESHRSSFGKSCDMMENMSMQGKSEQNVGRVVSLTNPNKSRNEELEIILLNELDESNTPDFVLSDTETVGQCHDALSMEAAKGIEQDNNTEMANIIQVSESEDSDGEIIFKDNPSQNFTLLKKAHYQHIAEDLVEKNNLKGKTIHADDNFDENESEDNAGDVSMVTDSDLESDTIVPVPNIMVHKKSPLSDITQGNTNWNELSPVIEHSTGYRTRSKRSISVLHGDKQQEVQFGGKVVLTPKRGNMSGERVLTQRSSQGLSPKKSSSEELNQKRKCTDEVSPDDNILAEASPKWSKHPERVSVHTKFICDTSATAHSLTPKVGRKGGNAPGDSNSKDVYQFTGSDEDSENDIITRNSKTKSGSSKELTPSEPRLSRMSTRSRSTFSESDKEGQGQVVGNHGDSQERFTKYRTRSSSESDKLEKEREKSNLSLIVSPAKTNLITEEDSEVEIETESKLFRDFGKNKRQTPLKSTVSKSKSPEKKEETLEKNSSELRRSKRKSSVHLTTESQPDSPQERNITKQAKSKVVNKETVKSKNDISAKENNRSELSKSSDTSMQGSKQNGKRQSCGKSSSGKKKEVSKISEKSSMRDLASRYKSRLETELSSLRESISEDIDDDTYDIGGYALRKGNYELKVSRRRTTSENSDVSSISCKGMKEQSDRTGAKSEVLQKSDKEMVGKYSKEKTETDSKNLRHRKSRVEEEVTDNDIEGESLESSDENLIVQEECDDSDEGIPNKRSRSNSRSKPRTSQGKAKSKVKDVGKSTLRRSQRLSERS